MTESIPPSHSLTLFVPFFPVNSTHLFLFPFPSPFPFPFPFPVFFLTLERHHNYTIATTRPHNPPSPRPVLSRIFSPPFFIRNLAFSRNHRYYVCILSVSFFLFFLFLFEQKLYLLVIHPFLIIIITTISMIDRLCILILILILESSALVHVGRICSSSRGWKWVWACTYVGRVNGWPMWRLRGIGDISTVFEEWNG